MSEAGVREAGVPAEVNRLRKAAEDLSQEIERLEARLSPVLQPSRPQPEVANAKLVESARVPLSGDIAAQVDRMIAASARLRDLQQRLEV